MSYESNSKNNLLSTTFDKNFGTVDTLMLVRMRSPRRRGGRGGKSKKERSKMDVSFIRLAYVCYGQGCGMRGTAANVEGGVWFHSRRRAEGARD